MTAARVELGAPTQLSNPLPPPKPPFTFLQQQSLSPPLSFVSISRSDRHHPAPDSEDLLLFGRSRRLFSAIIPNIVYPAVAGRELMSLFIVTVTCGCFSVPLCPDVKKWYVTLLEQKQQVNTNMCLPSVFPSGVAHMANSKGTLSSGNHLIFMQRAAAVLPRAFVFILQIDWISKPPNRYKMYVTVLHHCAEHENDTVCFEVVKKFKKLKFHEYASRFFFFFYYYSWPQWIVIDVK